MNFANPHFAEPHWLWLAVLAPLLLLGLQRYAARARRRQLARVASPHFMEELIRSHSPLRRGLKNVLLVLGVTGVGIALARPQWGEKRLDTTQLLGEDIIFALDCSHSMLATDVSPNRLDRARLSMLDFIRQYGNGRVGLVAFAGQAFLQCPLTFDHDAFSDALMAVNETTIQVQGTDVGRALDEAFRAMEKNTRRKLIVLLTDGEDLEENGVSTAEALAGEGVTVFAIGVGTRTGGEIRTTDEQGQTGWLRDEKGNIVHSRLDETTLRRIAQVTGGGYYPMGAVGEGLAGVRSAVELMAGGDTAPARRLGIDRFYIPLAAVLTLLVVEPLLGTRRRAKRADE